MLQRVMPGTGGVRLLGSAGLWDNGIKMSDAQPARLEEKKAQ